MDKTKKKRWVMWLLIILGIAVVVIAAFFIVRAFVGSNYGLKEYSNIEESADGVSIKLNSVERLPMTDEKCQERMTVLTASDENYDCVIANVTITNNTGETLDYSYRNFRYKHPRSEQLVRTAITLTSFEGVDVTKELASGESHTQEAHLTIRKDDNLNELQLVYLVDPSADDSAEIMLPLSN